MSETCEYCGSPLGFSPMGDYCTNEECSYIDGHYSGPRQKRPAPERTFSESDLRLAREKAYREAAEHVNDLGIGRHEEAILALIDQPALDQHDAKLKLACGDWVLNWCDRVGIKVEESTIRQGLGVVVCGTAVNADTSTNEAILPTAMDASSSEELPLLPEEMWKHLTPERQAQVRKWFDLATKYLQEILDGPDRDAELKAQFAAVMEKAISETNGTHVTTCLCDLCNRAAQVRALTPSDWSAVLAEHDDLIRKHFQKSIDFESLVAERVREAVREEAEWWARNKKLSENEAGRLAAHRAAAEAPSGTGDTDAQ